MGHLQHLQRITIWGVGLIGGSLGLALKKNGFQGQRVGLGRNKTRLEKARRYDAVDIVTTDITTGIRGSDLVVLCTPVDLIPALIPPIVEAAPPHPHLVITDVGSTKSVVVQAVEAQLLTAGPDAPSFVGGHPMAGSHETGVDAARPTLFEGATCILTPTDTTRPESLHTVTELWNAVGGIPHLLNPETHDRLIGAASHLPHLVASMLAATVGRVKTEQHAAVDFAATGFRDSTRIAAGDPDLWTGIFTQNSDVLATLIDDMVGNLTEFKALLQTGNLREMERLLLDAQAIVEAHRKAQERS